METKRLYKSRQNRMLSGVCGGIAEYFNVDPTIIRLLAVLIAIVGTAVIGGIIAYIVCAVVIPDAPA